MHLCIWVKIYVEIYADTSFNINQGVFGASKVDPKITVVIFEEEILCIVK